MKVKGSWGEVGILVVELDRFERRSAVTADISIRLGRRGFLRNRLASNHLTPEASGYVPPMTAPIRSADWILDLEEPVSTLSLSPDGTRVVVLGIEGNGWVVDVVLGAILQRFKGHEGGGFQTRWNPVKDCFATSGQDGVIRIWDAIQCTVLESFSTGSAWGEQLAWSPNGECLAAGAGKELTLWRAQSGVVHRLRDQQSTITALAWRHDGSRIASACYGGVTFFDPVTGQNSESLPWKSSLLSLAISPDQRWVVAGTQEMSVQIWPTPFIEGEELAMSGYAAKVRELAWHHSSRYLATGGGDEIMVWDCGGRGPAGSTPRILEGHADRLSALAYQHRGHLLASGGQDGSVIFWNAGKSSQALRQIRLSSTVTALAWTPDDRRVLAGLQDGRLAAATPPG